MSCCLIFTELEPALRLRRYSPAQRKYSRVCIPFHWYGVCGLGTKFDTRRRHLVVPAA